MDVAEDFILPLGIAAVKDEIDMSCDKHESRMNFAVTYISDSAFPIPPIHYVALVNLPAVLVFQTRVLSDGVGSTQ